MDLTKLRRHQWIREESPLVFEVVDKFPYLATTKWVSMIIPITLSHTAKFLYSYVENLNVFSSLSWISSQFLTLGQIIVAD